MIDESGRALVFRCAIDYVGFGVSASIDRATVGIKRKYVRCASFRAHSQPTTIWREAYVSHFGIGVTAIQRVQVFDHCARAFERIDVYLKHVEVLSKRIGRDQQTTVVIEFKCIN